MRCTFCGQEECSCNDWRRVQLDDQTHANIGTAGTVMIKQRRGGPEVVVILSAEQFAHLVEAVTRRLAEGN